MKKLILSTGIISLLLLLSLVIAANPDRPVNNYPVLSKQVEVRVAHYKIAAKIIELSMQDTIEYINEITNDTTATDKLNELFTEFKDLQNQLDVLETHIGLNNLVRTSQQNIREFKTEKNRLMREYKGRHFELGKKFLESLDEHSDEIDALTENYWALRKANSIEVLEKRIEHAQKIIDVLEKNDYDITEAQAKLDEISAKKDELATALDKKDNLAIAKTNVEILQLSIELRQITIDLQIDIPHKTRIAYFIHKGNRIVPRTQQVINELETLGIDVTELQTIQDKAKSKLDEANSKFLSNDLEGAVTALKELKTILEELAKAYINIRNEHYDNTDVISVIDKTDDALNSAIDNLETDLE